jgi:membrane-associated phospholipid phosphatase
LLNAAWVIAAALSLQSGPPAPAQPSPAWTDDQPLTHIAQNLKHDLVTLPRPETLTLLAAGVGGTIVVHRADDRTSAWARRSGDWSYTRLGGAVGDVWMQGGAAVTTYLIGKLNKSPEVVHVGGDLIRAQMLNGVLTTGIKIAAGRTRPTGSARSFPSGHSSATFASATVLADHYGWKAALPAYALAGFVSYTRVRDNQHWLSDVAFGSALGLIAGKTITAGHRHPAFVILPTITKSGAGLLVVKR